MNRAECCGIAFGVLGCRCRVWAIMIHRLSAISAWRSILAASSSRCRRIVLSRAISLRVFLNWLGSSSFSVTAWVRRSNRCFCFSRQLVPQVARVSFFVDFLASSWTHPLSVNATACRRCTNRHGIGILWATRARRRLAVASSTPVISNIIVPGFTTAHQIFRFAFALAHAGFQRLGRHRLVREDADKHPAFAAKEVAARHAAGFDLPGRDPADFSACKPYSPKATVLPRVALPFILPRWLLRNFTRLGIIGIGHQLLSIHQRLRDRMLNIF